MVCHLCKAGHGTVNLGARQLMSDHFPLSWAEWKEGTENLYLLKEILEERLRAGITLSREEDSILRAAQKVAARYQRNGRKKPPMLPESHQR